MKRKCASLFLALALLLLALTGCAAAPEATAAPTAAPETTAAPTASPENTAAPEAGAEPEEEAVPVRVMALKGPTAMGLVQFMDGADKGEIADNDYSFQIVGSVDEVTPNLVQGNVDIAAAPAPCSTTTPRAACRCWP